MHRGQLIAASSTEAEIIAASSTSLEIVFFRRLLEELGLPQDGPTVLYVDNTGAIALSREARTALVPPSTDRGTSSAATSRCASTSPRSRST